MITPQMLKEYRRVVGPLSRESDDALKTLVDNLNFDPALKDAPENEIAYILATAWFETHVPALNQRFKPVIETHNGKANSAFFEDTYGFTTKRGKELGNTEAGDGSTYRGRGYIQISGKGTYRRISKEMGEGDFLVSPNCACFAAINPFAYKILSIGMRKGLFTGKKLDDYRKKNGGYDFVKAREIVGTDHAEDIAGHARQIYSILIRRIESEAA